MKIKRAILWMSFWIGLALIFNIGIYFIYGYNFNFFNGNNFSFLIGKEKALEFLGGYIIELSLSMDNLFLFLLIFGSFGIPAVHQRRVLNYGIAGAVVLRLIFIVLGVAVVNRFHWVLYVFGIILLISGFKIFFKKEEEEQNFKDSLILKILGKVIPVSATLEGDRFLVRKDKIFYATPLLAILILIEGSDIIFAIDSIPAIFSITKDPFIVYSSNIFAILGLRCMYFILEKLQKAFCYVKYGVALILIFTGVKLSILFFDIEIPVLLSVIIILVILVLSMIASWVIKDQKNSLLLN